MKEIDKYLSREKLDKQLIESGIPLKKLCRWINANVSYFTVDNTFSKYIARQYQKPQLSI